MEFLLNFLLNYMCSKISKWGLIIYVPLEHRWYLCLITPISFFYFIIDLERILWK